jgi:hypothetical protein
MKRFVLVLTLSIWFGCLAWASPAHACPNCQDAITDSGDGDSDPLRESRAYNHSIYLMAFMPYLLFGGLGIVMYRSAKAADRQAQLRMPAPQVPGTGEESI